MSASPVERLASLAPSTDEWTAEERYAISMVDLCLTTRRGKVFGTGLHRLIRLKCKLGSRRATRVIHYVLTERGYYDALSASAAKAFPELGPKR